MKTAVITGASGGIGASLARAFAADGYAVALCCNHNRETADQVCKELNETDVFAPAAVFVADVTDSASVAELFAAIEEKLGPVDVLVNNAGVGSQQLLTDVTDEEYDRIMDTNLRGTFLCCRAVLPGMIHRKEGVILNISSMWGQTGGSCEVVYSASKAGVIGLTKALAKEVGPSGIRVNAIAPGVIDTPMNAIHSEETLEALTEETPMGRIGKPHDVASAAVFLASKRASFITGQVLGVNGGIVI